MSEKSRYIIGIDLGTTNSAVVYVDTEQKQEALQLLRIPQLGKHSTLEALPVLPSFLYLAESEYVVGRWALEQGTKVPTRLVASAKSWLSNPAANRRDKILPLEAIDEALKLSPVEATRRYLSHIRTVWNQQMAKSNAANSLEEQEVILTVPASFDEVARTLTIEAAKQAGYTQITLLEEPQAALYSYLFEHGKKHFRQGDTILVCDVGGGTTDFSLIDVVEGDDLRRMAVGKHLLLGGDNMDAALCQHIEGQLGLELDSTQHLSLLHQARTAKEALLTDQQTFSIFFSGKGSSVVGGSHSFELSSNCVHDILVDGFFGEYPFEEALQLKKGSGIRHMGLPYEAEPSITKQLANFLNQNKCMRKPTHLLFNGGSMKPEIFQKRIEHSLNQWFGEGANTQVLSSKSLDLAVAYGAAYFGKVRRGEGIRIGGGIPRAYYLEIEMPQSKQALTLLARGTEEGTRLVSDHLFHLTPNQPVCFQLDHSHTRLNDIPGSLIPIDEKQLTRLPSIRTICTYGKQNTQEQIPVKLETHLTEIGTLELSLLSQVSAHRWNLEFQLRGQNQEERSFESRLTDQTFDASYLEPAKQTLKEAFSIGSQNQLKTILPTLEAVLEKERKQWSPSILRGLFPTVLESAEKRLLASQYEEKFWNLAGFFLRPGIGYPLDDHRIKQLWKLILEDHQRQIADEVHLQQWICFRRIAAGLSKGQQDQLFSPLFTSLYNKKKRGLNAPDKKNTYAYSEQLRTAASLELAPTPSKIKLGEALVEKICKGKGEVYEYWALGRLGARELCHGSLANVVSPQTCEQWVKTLLGSPAATHKQLPFTLTLLARKTHVRELDLSPSILDKITPLIEKSPDLQELLYQERGLSNAEQSQIFGEHLPLGLSVVPN